MSPGDTPHLAEHYEQVSDLQLGLGKRLIESLDLREGARLLDVGCGTGRLARWASRRLVVTGVDPSNDRIQVARQQGGAATFAVGEAEDLSAFADASFDAVCMSSVLHWVADKGKALAEARRVLRPGGRLGVTTQPQELSKSTTLGLVFGSVLSNPGWAARVDRSMLALARPCTTTELLTLLHENGLELAELHLTPSAVNWPSGEAVLQFIEASAFGTFMGRVPEALRPALRADLVAAFEAQKGPAGIAQRTWATLLIATRP